MSIITDVQHWRPYLQQAEFHILTNHKSLCQMNEQRLHINWQHKVFTKLPGLQYKVIYNKGSENRAADALSQRSHDTAELHVMSVLVPQWLQSIRQSYSTDPATQEVITKLSVSHFAG
jgi:hypothetical protein